MLNIYIGKQTNKQKIIQQKEERRKEACVINENIELNDRNKYTHN